MEFTIRILVVIVLIVIAFVVFVALIGMWSGDANAMWKGLSDWFKQILAGGMRPATGTGTSGGSGIPGIGNLPSGVSGTKT